MTARRSLALAAAIFVILCGDASGDGYNRRRGNGRNGGSTVSYSRTPYNPPVTNDTSNCSISACVHPNISFPSTATYLYNNACYLIHESKSGWMDEYDDCDEMSLAFDPFMDWGRAAVFLTASAYLNVLTNIAQFASGTKANERGQPSNPPISIDAPVWIGAICDVGSCDQLSQYQWISNIDNSTAYQGSQLATLLPSTPVCVKNASQPSSEVNPYCLAVDLRAPAHFYGLPCNNSLIMLCELGCGSDPPAATCKSDTTGACIIQNTTKPADSYCNASTSTYYTTTTPKSTTRVSTQNQLSSTATTTSVAIASSSTTQHGTDSTNLTTAFTSTLLLSTKDLKEITSSGILSKVTAQLSSTFITNNITALTSTSALNSTDISPNTTLAKYTSLPSTSATSNATLSDTALTTNASAAAISATTSDPINFTTGNTIGSSLTTTLLPSTLVISTTSNPILSTIAETKTNTKQTSQLVTNSTLANATFGTVFSDSSSFSTSDFSKSTVQSTTTNFTSKEMQSSFTTSSPMPTLTDTTASKTPDTFTTPFTVSTSSIEVAATKNTSNVGVTTSASGTTISPVGLTDLTSSTLTSQLTSILQPTSSAASTLYSTSPALTFSNYSSMSSKTLANVINTTTMTTMPPSLSKTEKASTTVAKSTPTTKLILSTFTTLLKSTLDLTSFQADSSLATTFQNLIFSTKFGTSAAFPTLHSSSVESSSQNAAITSASTLQFTTFESSSLSQPTGITTRANASTGTLPTSKSTFVQETSVGSLTSSTLQQIQTQSTSIASKPITPATLTITSTSEIISKPQSISQVTFPTPSKIATNQLKSTTPQLNLRLPSVSSKSKADTDTDTTMLTLLTMPSDDSEITVSSQVNTLSTLKASAQTNSQTLVTQTNNLLKTSTQITSSYSETVDITTLLQNFRPTVRQDSTSSKMADTILKYASTLDSMASTSATLNTSFKTTSLPTPNTEATANFVTTSQLVTNSKEVPTSDFRDESSSTMPSNMTIQPTNITLKPNTNELSSTIPSAETSMQSTTSATTSENVTNKQSLPPTEKATTTATVFPTTAKNNSIATLLKATLKQSEDLVTTSIKTHTTKENQDSDTIALEDIDTVTSTQHEQANTFLLASTFEVAQPISLHNALATTVSAEYYDDTELPQGRESESASSAFPNINAAIVTETPAFANTDSINSYFDLSNANTDIPFVTLPVILLSSSKESLTEPFENLKNTVAAGEEIQPNAVTEEPTLAALTDNRETDANSVNAISTNQKSEFQATLVNSPIIQSDHSTMQNLVSETDEDYSTENLSTEDYKLISETSQQFTVKQITITQESMTNQSPLSNKATVRDPNIDAKKTTAFHEGKPSVEPTLNEEAATKNSVSESCQMTQWETYAPCSVTCGEANYLRTRRPMPNQPSACSNETESSPCNIPKCNPMSEPEKLASRVMMNVGCVWILVGLGLAILAFACLRHHYYLQIIHVNEDISLLLAHLALWFFAARNDDSFSQDTCKLAALGLQYFFGVTFLLQAMEALHIYTVLTDVAVGHDAFVGIKKALAISWGLPAVITGITAACSYDKLMSDFACWINAGDIVMFATFVPLVIVAWPTAVLLEATGGGSTQRKSRNVNSCRLAHGGLSLVFAVQFASWFMSWSAIYYQNVGLFTVVLGINALLGMLIYIFHVFSNEKARVITKNIYYKVKEKIVAAPIYPVAK